MSREIAKASAGRVGGQDQAERESDRRAGGDDRAHLGDRDKGHGQNGEVQGEQNDETRPVGADRISRRQAGGVSRCPVDHQPSLIDVARGDE